jgi:arginase
MTPETAITKPSICLIGCPMDLGGGRRGVDMGPSALRIAGISAQIKAMGYAIHDVGDILVHTPESQTRHDAKLKYLPEIAAVCRSLCDTVAAAIDAAELPVVLGGDHSMSIGTLGGIASRLKPGARLGVIWIDAHPDINTPDSSPSGNIHGMPLAVALGHGSPELTGIGGTNPKVDPQNLVYIGLRSVDGGERGLIGELGIKAFTMVEIDRLRITGVVEKTFEYLLDRCDHLHVSFDVDSLDPTFAPGVGTPVMGGLTYREAHYVMDAIARTGRLASLEIAEVNPTLDHHNVTAEIAVSLAATVLGRRVL